MCPGRLAFPSGPSLLPLDDRRRESLFASPALAVHRVSKRRWRYRRPAATRSDPDVVWPTCRPAPIILLVVSARPLPLEDATAPACVETIAKLILRSLRFVWRSLCP